MAKWPRTEHVMGMPVTIAVRRGAADLDAAFAWLRWVDRTFSPFDPASEISRLRRGEAVATHPLVREVLDRCDALRARTGGYFDARYDGALDPSGLVKGWAVDRAARLLAAGGARDFMVDAAGDVVVRGGRWRVGIRHPRRPALLCAVLELTDAAVATSGAYERGEHIVDPHTRRPPRGTLSVTLVGADLATADAYATAAFAMGRAGPAWTAGLDGYDALTVTDTGRVLSTPGLDRCRASM